MPSVADRFHDVDVTDAGGRAGVRDDAREALSAGGFLALAHALALLAAQTDLLGEF